MKLIQAVVFMCLTLFGSIVAAAPNAPDQPVGKVILATGDVYANQVALSSGASIYIGQSLATAAGGHLHIRMIDGAFLSLRPSTSVKVALYTVDLETPANTQIRIDVQHGVVRSVTGKGGETNKSAFRLNTPVAAIGIRGTDFTVYTDAISSVVDIRKGGIEMTPFSDACSPYTLGVCGGGYSVTLLDRDPGLLAEVHAARQKANRVSKANATIIPDQVEPAHPSENSSLKQAKEHPVIISNAPTTDNKTTVANASADNNQTKTEDVPATAKGATTATPESTKALTNATATTPGSAVNESKTGNAMLTNTESSATTVAVKSPLGTSGLVSNSSATVDIAPIGTVATDVGPKGSVTSELANRVITQSTTDSSIKAVQAEVTHPTIPPTATVTAVAKSQPFYWGRWSNYAENADQNIVRDPARNRQVFTANTAMLLASTESTTPNLPKSGVINFREDQAEAHVLRGGTLHDAGVQNAMLAVNFDQNHFSTSLDVSSNQLANGTEHLRATGTLNASQGILRSSVTGSNMNVSGKVADGASHAAYLFDQESTGIVGAISWQAQ